MKTERMTVKEFVETKQPKETAIKMICALASGESAVSIKDTSVWEILSEYTGVTADDFYVDYEGAVNKYGKNTVDLLDFKYWRYKNDKELF